MSLRARGWLLSVGLAGAAALLCGCRRGPVEPASPGAGAPPAAISTAPAPLPAAPAPAFTVAREEPVASAIEPAADTPSTPPTQSGAATTGAMAVASPAAAPATPPPAPPPIPPPSSLVGWQLSDVQAAYGEPQAVLGVSRRTTWIYGNIEIESDDGSTVSAVRGKTLPARDVAPTPEAAVAEPASPQPEAVATAPAPDTQTSGTADPVK